MLWPLDIFSFIVMLILICFLCLLLDIIKNKQKQTNEEKEDGKPWEKSIYTSGDFDNLDKSQWEKID